MLKLNVYITVYYRFRKRADDYYWDVNSGDGCGVCCVGNLLDGIILYENAATSLDDG